MMLGLFFAMECNITKIALRFIGNYKTNRKRGLTLFLQLTCLVKVMYIFCKIAHKYALNEKQSMSMSLQYIVFITLHFYTHQTHKRIFIAKEEQLKKEKY